MFGFFKKRKPDNILNDEQEKVLNLGIFLVNFSKIFDSETFDSKTKTLPEKLWIYAATLAQMVFDTATDGEKQICEYKTPEKTAIMIIYMQAVEIVANSLKFTDKQLLTNIYIDGGYLMCD